jgi:3',5'-cyclic AMP phosphodiesterase CpdA
VLKFIHLTDPHLVGRNEALYGTDPAWRLRACVADILATQGDAAFCLITGDLTHRGGSDAFALLRETLQPLPMPVHLAVGNHDDRDDLHAAFPDSFRDADGFVQGRVDTPEGVFLILDTMEPGCSHGVFCDRRADWLARMLAESGARPFYLCLHHPPFPVGIPGMDRLTLRESTPFLRAIAPHRAQIRTCSSAMCTGRFPAAGAAFPSQPCTAPIIRWR